jgi:hypothetical protein
MVAPLAPITLFAVAAIGCVSEGPLGRGSGRQFLAKLYGSFPFANFLGSVTYGNICGCAELVLDLSPRRVTGSAWGKNRVPCLILNF